MVSWSYFSIEGLARTLTLLPELHKNLEALGRAVLRLVVVSKARLQGLQRFGEDAHAFEVLLPVVNHPPASRSAVRVFRLKTTMMHCFATVVNGKIA